MEALLYDKLEDQKVQCHLCHHHCVIKPGRRGICHVRDNQSGTLHTLVYGQLIAQNADPIEKKPLFHLKPASRAYSVATVGCNFRCRFCQNADIAQMPADRNGMIMGHSATPQAVVRDAVERHCASIAYTYTEPTIFFEFALATARLAHDQGLKNVMVTNGYMTLAALEMIAPYLDAANVDLKSFRNDFYKTQCGARLAGVLETLAAMKSRGIWVEVTTLLIPGLNDGEDELRDLAKFLVDSLGPETPWHVSRFHPTYHLMDRPVTPVETIFKARQIGIDAGLRYVYTGNIAGEGGEDTFCHQCGMQLVQRRGLLVLRNRVRSAACPACNAVIDGIDMSPES
jgi:pyruvate formate lyase activating enzyme